MLIVLRDQVYLIKRANSGGISSFDTEKGSVRIVTKTFGFQCDTGFCAFGALGSFYGNKMIFLHFQL